MPDYSKYTDKAVRNKRDQDEVEQAFTAMQAQEAANRVIAKYSDEPRFLMEVTGKIIDGLKKHDAVLD